MSPKNAIMYAVSFRAKTRSRPFVQFVHHAVQWVELPVAWWKNEHCGLRLSQLSKTVSPERRLRYTYTENAWSGGVGQLQVSHKVVYQFTPGIRGLINIIS